MADVVIPAEIDRQARVILAKGEAAPTLENGAAQVEVLRAMSDAWITMGDKAKELYVIQHLGEIVGTVVSQMSSIDIDSRASGTSISTTSEAISASSRIGTIGLTISPISAGSVTTVPASRPAIFAATFVCVCGTT
jgi:flotillin